MNGIASRKWIGRVVVHTQKAWSHHRRGTVWSNPISTASANFVTHKNRPRYFSSLSTDSTGDKQNKSTKNDNSIRLSKLVSQHSINISMSRREAERLIQMGEVTIAGKPITSPHFLVDIEDSHSAIKVSGKHVHLNKDTLLSSNGDSQGKNTNITKVWLVNKLAGEVVSEFDPQGRPSMLERLKQGGVGRRIIKKRRNKSSTSDGTDKPIQSQPQIKQYDHLKAIGRLDLSTEGLIIVTNDGHYKRQLELPSSQFHRVYRARVHGKLTLYKLKALRKGITIENMRYAGMKVQMETSKSSSTNNWLRITCIEGKNRQIRKVMNHLGLNVTRLIRVSFGDYELQSIPPGMAIEVPVKSFHKRSGPFVEKTKKSQSTKMREERDKRVSHNKEEKAPKVQWVRNI